MAGKAEKKWNGRTVGGTFGLGFLIEVLGKMPLWGAYLLLDISLPFHLLFHPSLMRSSKSYFRKRVGCGRCEAFRRAYGSNRLFGQMMFDRFRFFSKGPEGYEMKKENGDQVLDLLEKKEGVVICGSHVGSPEMLGYMLSTKNYPISALVYAGENSTLQKERAGAFDDHGIKMIPISSDMSHLFAAKAALDAGEGVTVICDRAEGDSRSELCDFLGGKAKFPSGAFTMAATLGKEVVAMFCMKEGRRCYNFISQPIEVDRTGKSSRQVAHELLSGYVSMLEDVVKRYPDQWFNFYDFWEKE